MNQKSHIYMNQKSSVYDPQEPYTFSKRALYIRVSQRA